MLSPADQPAGPDSLQTGEDDLAGSCPFVQPEEEVVPGWLPAHQVEAVVVTEEMTDRHPGVEVGQPPPLAGAEVETLEDVGAVLHPAAHQEDVRRSPGQDGRHLPDCSNRWRQPGPGETLRVEHEAAALAHTDDPLVSRHTGKHEDIQVPGNLSYNLLLHLVVRAGRLQLQFLQHTRTVWAGVLPEEKEGGSHLDHGVEAALGLLPDELLERGDPAPGLGVVQQDVAPHPGLVPVTESAHHHHQVSPLEHQTLPGHWPPVVTGSRSNHGAHVGHGG